MRTACIVIAAVTGELWDSKEERATELTGVQNFLSRSLPDWGWPLHSSHPAFLAPNSPSSAFIIPDFDTPSRLSRPAVILKFPVVVFADSVVMSTGPEQPFLSVCTEIL